jgi:TonB family protein
MTLRLLATALAAATVIGISGCATSGGGSPGAACRSDLAIAPTSLTEAVDSAALLEDLVGTWISASGLTVATVPYDSVGSLSTVRVTSEFLPEDAEEELGQILARHAHSTGDPNTMVDLFVGDEAGPSPRRVRELRRCAPQLGNRDFLAAAMVSAAETLPLDTRTTVRLYALVLENGSVGDVRIEQPSRSATADEAAVSVMYLATFVPGQVEGMPTTTWVNFPVTFQARRSDPPAIDRPRPGD